MGKLRKSNKSLKRKKQRTLLKKRKLRKKEAQATVGKSSNILQEKNININVLQDKSNTRNAVHNATKKSKGCSVIDPVRIDIENLKPLSTNSGMNVQKKNKQLSLEKNVDLSKNIQHENENVILNTETIDSSVGLNLSYSKQLKAPIELSAEMIEVNKIISTEDDDTCDRILGDNMKGNLHDESLPMAVSPSIHYGSGYKLDGMSQSCESHNVEVVLKDEHQIEQKLRIEEALRVVSKNMVLSVTETALAKVLIKSAKKVCESESNISSKIIIANDKSTSSASLTLLPLVVIDSRRNVVVNENKSDAEEQDTSVKSANKLEIDGVKHLNAVEIEPKLNNIVAEKNIVKSVNKLEIDGVKHLNAVEPEPKLNNIVAEKNIVKSVNKLEIDGVKHLNAVEPEPKLNNIVAEKNIVKSVNKLEIDGVKHLNAVEIEPKLNNIVAEKNIVKSVNKLEIDGVKHLNAVETEPLPTSSEVIDVPVSVNRASCCIVM